MELEIIWAEATCEVWKERLNEGSCSFGECIEALEKGTAEVQER